MRRKHYGCKADGCGEPHKAQGYCSLHYARFLRGTLNKPRGHVGCNFEGGCDRPHFGKGYCSAHYVQHAKGRPLTPIRVRVPSPDECTVEGCTEPHKALGFCRWHYDRDRRGLDVTILRSEASAASTQTRRPTKPRKAATGPTEPASRPVSVLPAGWDKVTPPKVHTRTRTSTRGDALGPLTPLKLGTVAAMALVVANLGDGRYTEDGLDLMDALNLREMAAEARARLAVAS